MSKIKILLVSVVACVFATFVGLVYAACNSETAGEYTLDVEIDNLPEYVCADEGTATWSVNVIGPPLGSTGTVAITGDAWGEAVFNGSGIVNVEVTYTSEVSDEPEDMQAQIKVSVPDDAYVNPDDPADDKCEVMDEHLFTIVKVDLGMGPYLGIYKIDSTTIPVDSETATATVTPDISASYSWSLNSLNTVFDPAPPTGNTATIKETGTPSANYQDQKVTVQITPSGCMAEADFTVVRVDVEMKDPQGNWLSEADEETGGGYVLLNDDDDNTNGSSDLTESSITGEDDLIEVKITLFPADLPSAETVTITSGNVLYRNSDKSTPFPDGTYPVSSFPLTLWVEGKSASSDPRDKEIRAVFNPRPNACDQVKYTVVGVDFSIDRVCAQAVHSASHDVTVTLTPTTPGVPVHMSLVPSPGGAATFSPSGSSTIDITTTTTLSVLGTTVSSAVDDMIMRARINPSDDKDDQFTVVELVDSTFLNTECDDAPSDPPWI